MLSRGGLDPALTALAQRSSVPVALDLRVAGRLAEAVEIAAYYVVAEMLTNTAKHANASRVDVDVHVVDGVLRVSVRDDGVGGAAPAGGSGLVGLRDRVEALGGTIASTARRAAERRSSQTCRSPTPPTARRTLPAREPWPPAAAVAKVPQSGLRSPAALAALPGRRAPAR